jgi:hypothetical protein
MLVNANAMVFMAASHLGVPPAHKKNLDAFQLFPAAPYPRRLVAELKALARHTSGESRLSTALLSPARYRRNSTAPSHVTRRGEGRHQQGGNP